MRARGWWRRWSGRWFGGGGDVALLRQTALRLGAQAALTVAAIVVLLAGVAVLVVVDSQHAAELELVQDTALRADDVNDPPSDVWMTIGGAKGWTYTSGMPRWLPDQQALARVTASTDPNYVDLSFLDAHGHNYLVRTQRRDNEIVQAALDLHADAEERERLLTAFFASGVLGLVLAAVAGVWLGRRAVGPLAASLALQRRFVADAGHELRTPLTLLSTRAQMVRRDLRRGTDIERVKSDVDNLVADAQHLSAIIEDMLMAVDPRGEAPTERVDVAELAAHVVRAGQAGAGAIRLTIGGADAVLVRGVPTALRRAVTALVDNAIRHAHSEVNVTVRDGANAEIEVRDDGAGIDPALLPRLFDRFVSTGNATTGGNGTRRYGLGLALVSEIAARHGGRVQASNAADGGAVLLLTLPTVTRDEDPAD